MDTPESRTDGESSSSIEPLARDASTQSDDSLVAKNCELVKEIDQLKNELQQLRTTLQRLDPSLLSNSQLSMYTGLNLAEFNVLASWLTETSVGRRSLSPEDPCTPTFSQKLLLVLMRIKQNLTQDDLACRFSIDQFNVSRIITHWIPMLSVVLSDLIKIFIQRPSNLTTQKSSYSDYKSHTTVKYLVGIDTFTGVFVFISPGFSGNSSDRFTVEHSGILDLLKPGQRILAGKGYTARD